MTFKQKLDSYEVIARYIPAIISVIPLSHILLVLLTKDFLLSLSGSVDWMLVANISMPIVFGIAVVQFQTTFSKMVIEERVFGKNGINFPTTLLLLYSDDQYSDQKKDELRKKIKNEYNVDLLDKNSESANPQEAKLRCREVVSQIRRSVAGAGMVGSYNIRYGFMRNFIGGVIWVFGSVANAIYYAVLKDVTLSLFFSIWTIVVIGLFLLKRTILEKVAFSYADALMTEFSGKKES